MAVVLVAAACSLPACGAGDSNVETPVATLGATSEAEHTFRPLMRRWQLGTAKDRQDLDEQLADFERRFPRDDLRAMARVLRGWNALERGELKEANELVRQAHLGPAGVPRDLAALVVGATERRSGKPKAALRTMEPLQHKMLDGFATDLLNAELVKAAIGARLWMKAVDYMEVWQRETQRGNEDAVNARISELLARVPKAQLRDALDRRRRAGTIESGLETAKSIAQQLAVHVVESRDAQLARELLDVYGPLLGTYGEAVARLAADTVRGRVQARTVGVLLGLRTSAHRRRSADVVAGMAFGLGLPGSDARLVTRDGGTSSGTVRQAMTELASEGAAVIVAGVDADHTSAIAAFADEHSLPVMLLTNDASSKTSRFVFKLGHDPSTSLGALAADLKRRGLSPTAGFGASLMVGQENTIGVSFQRPCDALPGAPELRTRDIRSIMVFDGAYCARQVLDLANTMRVPLALGLGVAPVDKPGLRMLSAGVFPVDEDNADARLRGWLDSGRGVPSWWTALGHDAAALAYGAVKNLAASTTDDADVTARRLEATRGLAAAEAVLWTSEVRTFDADQRVTRTIEVLEGMRGAGR